MYFHHKDLPVNVFVNIKGHVKFFADAEVQCLHCSNMTILQLCILYVSLFISGKMLFFFFSQCNFN